MSRPWSSVPAATGGTLRKLLQSESRDAIVLYTRLISWEKLQQT
jgi:hypothetical protein